jgi:polar amino acid transport system substrate-binding protein
MILVAIMPIVAAFVEDMKASGFVAGALARHGIEGAAVPPAARGS